MNTVIRMSIELGVGLVGFIVGILFLSGMAQFGLGGEIAGYFTIGLYVLVWSYMRVIPDNKPIIEQ